MSISLILLAAFLNIGLETNGYVETRASLPWKDSMNFYGYGRGWLEFKTRQEYYGAQSAFDYFMTFDTTHTPGIKPGLIVSRLAVWLGPDNMRIIAGKQRILWGVARVFRPLDIFNPTNFFEPGYERSGVNAIQCNFSLASLTSARLLYLPHFNIKSSGLAGRMGSNLFKNDIGLNAYYRASDKKLIVGTDLAGEMLAGYWAEVTYTKDDRDKYLKTSVGIDYTFPFMIYGMLEYFYDQSGEPNPDRYDYSKIVAEGRSTLAQNYLYSSIALTHSMILHPSINALVNLNDLSLIVMPQISCQIWENTELNFGVNYTIGSYLSEFKNITGFNGLVFLWAKVYF